MSEKITNLEQLLAELSIADKLNINEYDSPDIHGLCLKLESKNMIRFKIDQETSYVLTEEGNEILKNGSPEYILIQKLSDGETIDDNKSIGVMHAIKKGWVAVSKSGIDLVKTPVIDDVQTLIIKVRENSTNLTKDEIKLLKKRKLIKDVKLNKYEITKGEEFKPQLDDLETELTAEMIANKSYLNKEFKKYNFETLGKMESKGAVHPLMKVKNEIHKIFLEMGFEEMKTDRYVESSFWNFDALFQPQSHPSREQHDTFFMYSKTKNIPKDFMEKTKNVHEGNHYDSIGYQTKWSEDEARKDILRTHTTAISARYLYDLAKNYRPIKYFSIDRVFRNESVDATHLAEFHQIEGFIVDKNLTLGHLKGVLKEFFEKLGLSDVKFKPAFNPYTEPSMEVFAYHEGMQKWIEVGNSGIFRPEMLIPMGFEKDVRVIAWGLSLERPTMIKYGIQNIRELIGHKININKVQENKICIFRD